MRITLFILLFSTLQVVAGSGYSQNARLNLNLQGATVREVLGAIEAQSEFYFLYNSELIDVQRKVDMLAKNESINQVLSKLFQKEEVEILVRDRHIILTPLAGKEVQQPAREIRGTVKSRDGELLPGVTIHVKATSIGTITDPDGNFSLRDVKAGQVLVFSFVGMRTQEVTVGNRTVFDIVMEEESIGIEEVIAVGYGVQKRSDITGSVASVNTEDMKVYPATNITEMLRGRASGINVINKSGRPGSTSSISIRGVRSFRDDSNNTNNTEQSNNPLYVVDGTPVTSTEFATINSEDVASVEILKDAASQAIYGARAANGVILVTTKRGTEGKTEVTFSSSLTSQHLWRNFDFYSPDEFFELRKQAIAHDNGVDASTLTPEEVLYDDEALAAYEAGRSTDWEKLMFDPAIKQTYNLGINGGNSKTKVSVSIGYLNHEGMVVTGSGYQRGNVRLNLDHEVYKWLSVGFNTSFSKTKTEKEAGVFADHITRSPFGMPYDEEGNLKQYINSTGDQNPLYNAQYIKDETTSDITRLNGFIDIRPFKGFTYRINAAYYNSFEENGAYKQAEYTGGGSAGSITHKKSFNYLIENIFTYNAPFRNKDHSLGLTAVQSWDRTYTTELGFGSNNVPVDAFWWDMIADGEVTSKIRTVNEHILLSYMARAQYSYKGRYMLNVAVRHDGSSRLAKGRKWSTFPSVAVAWRINEESFAENIDQISNLKLRVSYGQVGNQEGIGNYTTLGTTTDYKMEFGDNFLMGYLPGNSLPNPLLKWETTASANFGLDFGFFNNRLNGTVEYYRTNTTNLLVTRSINGVLGYTGMLDNLGETRTTGWDLSLSGDIVRNKAIAWNIGTNFSIFHNEILKIDDNVDENGNPVDNITNNWFIGKPINVYYQYKADGIYQEADFDLVDGKYVLKPTFDSDGDGVPDKALERSDLVEPGKVRIIDKNNDGKIDAEDRYVISKDPKFVTSVFTSFEFKGFDFFMDWYAVYGRKIQNSYLYNSNDGGSLQGKLNGVRVNYWTPDNPSNEWPRPSHNSNTTYQSSLAIQDASYIRLRSVTLGYTIPARITQKAMIKNARIYMTATNLLTFTDFLSYSPEFTPAGYPEPKQYTVGVNLTF
jgi:TonB-linked SusC/RagA family outer membrane protein